MLVEWNPRTRTLKKVLITPERKVNVIYYNPWQCEKHEVVMYYIHFQSWMKTAGRYLEVVKAELL